MSKYSKYHSASEIVTAAIRDDDELRLAFEANIAMSFLDNLQWYRDRTKKKVLNKSDFHAVANAAAKHFVDVWTARLRH